MSELTAVGLAGLLGEPDRMRVFAAIALGGRRPEDIVEVTGIPLRRVQAAATKLSRGGVLDPSVEGFAVDVLALRRAARDSAVPRPVDEDTDPVLRAFIRDGRVVTMPSAGPKRRALLEHLAHSFEPGVRYPEREVDAVLRAWHDDHAALRRYLVDERLLERDHNVYWRAS